MKIHVQNKLINNIQKTSILQQSAYWARVKRKHGIAAKAFDIRIKAADLFTQSDRKNKIVDDLLILFQNIGHEYQIGYVPYGPTLKPSEENQGIFLEALSESLRPHLPSGCIMLRYDLLWESLWARETNWFNTYGEWTGPPAAVNQEIRLNFDTQNWNLKKANTDILPSDTIIIDLRKDEKQLLNGMKPKTRYNVRLSQRKGIRVRKADIQELPVWYELYRETCMRNRFCLHDISHFEAVMGARVDAERDQTDAELLIAEIDNIPLAAMFLVFSAQRATYLYGASSLKNRRLMPAYALQWEAIKRAKKRGCTEYDMFGVAPGPDPTHPLFGLYRFKSGFGGRLFHRMGCWDYPLHLQKYKIYQTNEMISQGFHLR